MSHGSEKKRDGDSALVGVRARVLHMRACVCVRVCVYVRECVCVCVSVLARRARQRACDTEYLHESGPEGECVRECL